MTAIINKHYVLDENADTLIQRIESSIFLTLTWKSTYGVLRQVNEPFIGKRYKEGYIMKVHTSYFSSGKPMIKLSFDANQLNVSMDYEKGHRLFTVVFYTLMLLIYISTIFSNMSSGNFQSIALMTIILGTLSGIFWLMLKSMDRIFRLESAWAIHVLDQIVQDKKKITHIRYSKRDAEKLLQ